MKRSSFFYLMHHWHVLISNDYSLWSSYVNPWHRNILPSLWFSWCCILSKYNVPFFGFDICHLLHFTHVICNYRHIFTVLVNFMACKSQIFFSFCWSWSPALWSHPFNKDENRWPLRWIWCSSYSVGSQYIGIDMENRNAQGTPLNDLNIQLQQVINALMW